MSKRDIKASCGQTVVPKVDNTSQECHMFLKDTCIVNTNEIIELGINENDTFKDVISKMAKVIINLNKKIKRLDNGM